jgi:hypothetical protein
MEYKKNDGDIPQANAKKPESPENAKFPLMEDMSFEDIQRLRYTLPGAHIGDGDPPFRRDAYMRLTRQNMSDTLLSGKPFKYDREGD